MKIIKEGKITQKTYRKTCNKCQTEFEYTSSDVHSDWRDGDYVICPLPGCGAWINHDSRFLANGGSFIDKH